MKNILVGLALIGLCAQGASAALISGNSAVNLGAVATNVNLTTDGSVDWALI